MNERKCLLRERMAVYWPEQMRVADHPGQAESGEASLGLRDGALSPLRWAWDPITRWCAISIVNGYDPLAGERT